MTAAMQKITPFLWFDHEAEEAATLYTSLFEDSRITMKRLYGEAGPGPKGSVMTLSFQLGGFELMALNGGPYYAPTPAVSFFVNCATESELDSLWRGLSRDGKVLMELGRYPFSQKFGWLSDRYGVSWQLTLAPGSPRRIAPFLLFAGAQDGKAEEAMASYVSLFPGSRIEHVERQGGSVMHGRFTLAGQEFMAMDGGTQHDFGFTPAISFFVSCNSQDEVDRLWEDASAGGRKDRCGWLTDRYGVSWQIVPSVLGTLLADPDPARATRVMKAMLGMDKLDIRELQRAYAT